MKTLTIYSKDSFYKYPGIFEDYTYLCNEKNMLMVYERDRITGDETTHAVFKEWDYYLIEKDGEL